MKDNIEAVVFDLDGVLLRSDVLYADIAKTFSSTYDVGMISAAVTVGGDKLFRAVLGEDYSDSDIAEFRQMQIDYFDQDRHLFSGVCDFIPAIASSYKTFVLTNKPVQASKGILMKCGLLGCFQKVIGLDSGFAKKPSPDGLNFLIKEANVPPGNVIFIGDAFSDMECARNAGAQFGFCNYGFQGCDRVNADVEFSSVRDIGEFFK